MSRFKKFVNIIYYLISIGLLTILLILLNEKEEIFSNIAEEISINKEFLPVLSIFTAILLFISLAKLLGNILQKTDEKYLYLFDKDGQVSISNTAIEKTLANSLEEFEEIVEYRVGLKVKNKDEKSKVRIKIKCGLDESICRAKGYYDYIDEKNRIKEDEKDNKDGDLTKNLSSLDQQILENTSEENLENEGEKLEKEEFAPEIREAMNVILPSDEEQANKDGQDNLSLVHENKTIDDICQDIQTYLQDSMQEFLSQRISRIDIKFYEIDAKKYGHKKEKNHIKKGQKKKSKKNKRVN